MRRSNLRLADDPRSATTPPTRRSRVEIWVNGAVAARPGPALGRRAAVSPLWLVCAVTLCGAALRLYHLDYLSLWNDEIFSRYYYQTGLGFMWSEGLRSENSPPLYYMALGGWIQLFGSGEAALRGLSAACSTAAIALVYRLGKEAAGGRTGLLAAALFALSPTQIYYAQETRPYALLLLPLGVMLLACLRWLQRPGRLGDLALYGGAAVICVYIHATMVLLVFSAGLTVAAVAPGRWTDPARLRWLAVNAAVALVAVPELIGMAGQLENDTLTWIPSLRWRDIGAVVSNTVAGTLTPGQIGGMLALALLAALAVALWRRPPDAAFAAAFIAVPALYAGGVLAVSLLAQPMMLSRIFCWMGIPLCLTQARALLASGGGLRPLLAGLSAVTLGVGLFYQLAPSPDAKEPWRDVVAEAGGDLERAALVVLGSDTDPSDLAYYAPPLNELRMLTPVPRPATEIGIMPALFGTGGITPGEVAERINAGRSRIAAVIRASDTSLAPTLRRARLPDRVVARLCRNGNGEATSFPCGVSVLIWDPVQ